LGATGVKAVLNMLVKLSPGRQRSVKLKQFKPKIICIDPAVSFQTNEVKIPIDDSFCYDYNNMVVKKTLHPIVLDRRAQLTLFLSLPLSLSVTSSLYPSLFLSISLSFK